MKPLNKLSPEKRELYEMFALTKDLRDDICRSMMDSLDYEKSCELTGEILKTIDDEGATLFDKFTWAVRSAYIAGYITGIEVYAEAFELTLRKDGDGE